MRRSYWLVLGLLVGCNAVFGLDEVTPLATGGSGGTGASGGSGADGGATSGGAPGVGGTGDPGGAGGTGGSGGQEPCGNGVLDPGETCDGDCILPFDCFDDDVCTASVVTGADVCDAVCAHTAIAQCINDDGCCVNACGPNDNDCVADILVVAPDANNTVLGQLVSALDATGSYNSVTEFNAAGGTPSANELSQAYAVVYVGVDAAPDGTTMGDRLADYHDAGGRVVSILTTECDAYAPGGRFRNQGYYALEPAGYTTLALQLGTADEPDHPVMKGISNISTSRICQPQFVSGTRIASWDNGQPLAAAKLVNGRARVDLNVHVESNAVTAELVALIGNAIFYSQAFPAR